MNRSRHSLSPPSLARWRGLWAALIPCLAAASALVAAGPAGFLAGSSRVDISPTNAVRLMGYAGRANLPGATNVVQPIHARALALTRDDRTTVLVTLDNCILPGALSDEIRSRIVRSRGLAPGNIAFAVTHTHSAPCLTGAAPNIFAADIPPADQAAIDLYTRFFVGRVESAVLQALDHRVPARIAWGQGRVTFAANRRTAGGPVDHDFPILRVVNADGTLQAVLANYACHCTTLGDVNAVHGDWAGSAALELESKHPGTVALMAIGCGADANPAPRGTMQLADAHGHEIAVEAERLLALPLTEITNAPTANSRTIALPYRPHFTRAELEARSRMSGIVGHHARRWLARMERDGAPSPTLPYPVQTWSFGDQFAMVFLGGEVVVDYALRLKRELDPARLWVNGYANDVPCYIPSRRILSEGGYEAESSLWYYDRPQRLAPETEDLIVGTVKDLLPAAYRAKPRQEELPPPRDPARAVEAFHVPEGLAVDLVAGDGLVQSPVAIDFGPDGRLWVAEMFDYPSGAEGGGRLKVLEDTDGDGRYDRATVVARGLPFPTGLMQWRDGVLVCSAPDVLWFPGVATVPPPAAPEPRKLLSGFATHNYQARVNGLRWGLDGWIHGAGGLFGGRITSTRTGATVDANGRDFRWRPDTGAFEAESGVSQQVRDDFGEWFGNDNGSLLWHFPLAARHSRRNPGAPAAPTRVGVNRDGGRVYPTSHTLQRFNDPGSANQLTSACGPEIYRDSALGAAYAGNAFVCEPVHNLVRRAVLAPDGATFAARRAPGEASSEFLSSSDNWFRPVEVRTGPDGALWIVDMYRFVVEHPRWIQPERLAELDARAGANRGRIYRVHPASERRPSPWRLDGFDAMGLARRMDASNGVVRDLAHRLLLERRDEARATAVLAEIRRVAGESGPAQRAQALALLRDLDVPDETAAVAALGAKEPRLRRFAASLFERHADGALPPARLLALADDPDAGVRFQLALTLGTYPQPEAATAIAKVAAGSAGDPWIRHAVLCSCLAAPESFWAGLVRSASPAVVAEYRDPFLASVVGAGLLAPVSRLLADAVPAPGAVWDDAGRGTALALMAALEGSPALRVRLAKDPEASRRLARLNDEIAPRAAALATDPTLPPGLRGAAVRLLGERARGSTADRDTLLSLVDAGSNAEVRRLALGALGRLDDEAVARGLLSGWPRRAPAVRGETLAVLQQRPAWTRLLLEAVAQGKVAPTEIPPAARDQLRRHKDPSLAAIAAKAFPPADGSRADVIARFRDATTIAGDPSRGGPQFERLCSSCHALRGIGHAVGPDLTPFRPKSTADFLGAILDPSAAIDPRFVAYTVARTDGREQTGIVTEETDTSFVLVLPGGVRESVARTDVGRIEAGARSLMPEGLEEGLAARDLADLIAWIKQAPGVFGSVAPADAAVRRKAFVASGGARIKDPKATLDALDYPSWMGSFPFHLCRQTDGKSKVAWTVRPTRQADGVWRARMGVGLGFLTQPAGEFLLRVDGRDAAKFGVVLADTSWSGIDPRWRLRYRVEDVGAEDGSGVLDLEFTGEMPAGKTPEWHCEVTGSAAGSQRWFGVYDWKE